MTWLERALVAGMVVGAAVAAWGLGHEPMPVGVVAVVGSGVVTEADLRRATAGLDEPQHARILGRLVDEAILVERGIELGLPRTDKQARANLAAAVIALVTARADEAEPDEATLRAYHAERRALFRVTSRVHVRATHGRRSVELPDAPVPPAKLGDYLGPTAAKATLTLPLNTPTMVGDREITVVSRTAGADRAFEDVRALVEVSWRQSEADRALRDFLDAERRRLDVQTGD
jgi:hypothetical protein